MSLTDLPLELISCVVGNIESQPTLYNLAQCSNQLYHSTIPHLYRHVTVQEEFGYGKQQKEQLRKLASLLLRRPDLAGLVRSFTLQDGSEVDEDELDFCENIPALYESNERFRSILTKVDPGLKTAITALSLPKGEENDWLMQLCHAHECQCGLILALLLPALVCVEKLVLHPKSSFVQFGYYFETVMERAARREKPFDIQPAFESLTVFEAHSSSLLSETLMASLLKLPALRKISGCLGYMWEWSDIIGKLEKLNDLDSSSSPLTSLHLASNASDPYNLSHILRAPKALKTFFYTVNESAFFNFTGFYRFLEPQKKCLERLGLDHSEDYPYCYGSDETDGSFGPMTSFLSFETLKSFKTAAIFLRSTVNGTGRLNLINIFPLSLETLHLTRVLDGCESVLEAIEHLLAQKSPQQIPSLTTLILEDTKGSEPKLADVWCEGTQENLRGRFSRLAAAQGVSFDIVIPQ